MLRSRHHAARGGSYAPPPTLNTPPIPPPQAWSLLAFFVTTVSGLILEPVPAGAWVSFSHDHHTVVRGVRVGCRTEE
jgi:hypothetical protein